MRRIGWKYPATGDLVLMARPVVVFDGSLMRFWRAWSSPSRRAWRIASPRPSCSSSGVTYPIDACSRSVLNQCTQPAVSVSTSAGPVQVRRWWSMARFRGCGIRGRAGHRSSPRSALLPRTPPSTSPTAEELPATPSPSRWDRPLLNLTPDPIGLGRRLPRQILMACRGQPAMASARLAIASSTQPR